jgi:hypothetical protein
MKRKSRVKAKYCSKTTMIITDKKTDVDSFMEKLAEFSFTDEGKGADQGWAPEQGWISMLAVAVSAGVAGAVGMFMMFHARQRSSAPPLRKGVVEGKTAALP